ncbi:MAG: sigma-70 family RNA polymerase sigma factor [Polyangiales bacterium]
MSSSLPDLRIVYEGQLDFVWRSLRRLGVRESDVMEATQRVFLAIYAQLPSQSDVKEDPAHPPSTTGLFAICQRVASDYRRGHATASPSAVRPIAAPSNPVDRARAADWLLDKLPESQRAVFVLYELEELPCEQIAAMLGIAVGTVRSRLRLARERFGREVRRLHGEDADAPLEANV